MDLVNSVTQNSNNRGTTMENGPSDEENKPNRERGNQMSKSSSANEQRIFTNEKNQTPDYLRAIGLDPRKFWPKKYRFTREKSPSQHNPLSIAQRNFYESNGYIILDDCVPKRLLDQIKMSRANNDSEKVDRKSDFVDEFLLDKLLVKNGHLTQYVKCFCDEKIMLMTHRLIERFQTNEMARDLIDNGKAPSGEALRESQQSAHNSNGRQMLFRDWIYLPFRPIDKVVGTIVAVDPIEHVLLLVPGTHRVGQCTISSTLDNISAAYESSQEKSSATICKEMFESSPEKLSTIVDKSRKGFKYVNLKPGQTLFYHPGLVHGFSSDLVNFNKRQLATLAYYAAADCEFVDLRQTQLSFDERASDQFREQVPINLAHFGHLDPRDYRSWFDKPRLVTDKSANL